MAIDLEGELGRFAELPLECDGLTRVISFRLRELEVPHSIMVGAAFTGKRQVKPHWWIEMFDGRSVDYRARMWLGDEPLIPHGIFRRDDYPNVMYEGEEYRCRVSRTVFDILTANV